MNKYLVYILIIIVFSSCSVFRKGDKSRNVDGFKNEQDKLRFTFAFFEGNKHKMLGNYSEAAAYYTKCLQLNKKSAAALYELANLYILQGDNKTAILLAEEATKINPENIWYQLLLGALYDQSNEPGKAINLYKEILKKYPKRLDLKLDYAMLLSKAKKLNEAIKIYNNIEEQYGVSEEVSMEKEKIFLALGEKNKAYLELNKLIEAFPYESRYYGLLAEVYVSNEEYDKALDVYNRLITLDPDNGLGHFSLSEYYRIMKDYEKSYQELKIAFSSPDVNVDLKIKMLLSYYIYANDDETKVQAFELLDILTVTHPDDPKVLTVYGDFLVKEERYKEARDKFKQVTENNKNNYLVWEQLLFLESQLNKFKPMYEESIEALEYFPNQANLYLFKGISSSRLKKYDEAVEALHTGLGLIVDNDKLVSQFYTYLAEAYNKKEEHVLSDKYFDKALEINSEDKYILNNYSYYLSLRNENLDKAEEMAKKCTTLEPENATYLDTYAWVLFKAEKYNEALIIIEKAINSGGKGSAVIIEHYGDILFKTNKKEEAIIQWKKALEKGKGSELLEKKVADEMYYE